MIILELYNKKSLILYLKVVSYLTKLNKDIFINNCELITLLKIL